MSRSAAGETCLTLLVAVYGVLPGMSVGGEVSCLQQHGHLSAALTRILDAWLFGENFAVWATGRRRAGHLSD